MRGIHISIAVCIQAEVRSRCVISQGANQLVTYTCDLRRHPPADAWLSALRILCKNVQQPSLPPPPHPSLPPRPPPPTEVRLCVCLHGEDILDPKMVPLGYHPLFSETSTKGRSGQFLSFRGGTHDVVRSHLHCTALNVRTLRSSESPKGGEGVGDAPHRAQHRGGTSTPHTHTHRAHSTAQHRGGSKQSREPRKVMRTECTRSINRYFLSLSSVWPLSLSFVLSFLSFVLPCPVFWFLCFLYCLVLSCLVSPKTEDQRPTTKI
jgi:hypothetical protein